jgi:hypothetical protein
MPLLVTKKLVAADCACAGAHANADIAASAKHAGEIILVKRFIEVLPVVVWFIVINPPRPALFRRRDAEMKPTQSRKEKGAAE